MCCRRNPMPRKRRNPVPNRRTRRRNSYPRAQDFVSVIVGMVLIVLAGAELISGIIDFFADVKKTSLEPAGINLLDRVLLVLILVEIVHTVVLSLRAHHLVAQPFIIVGLVAVIRKVLVVLSGTGTVPTPQLA